jgi:integrase
MTASTKDRPQGRIFKPRGCRYWYIQYYDVQPRVTRSGRLTKRCTESTKSTSRAVAEARLRRVLVDKDDGHTILNPRKVTFTELARLIVTDYELKGKKSLKRLKVALVHLRKAFGADRAVHITPARWLAYMAARQKAGAAASTIMSERAALHRMFTLAVRTRQLASRPDFDRLDVHNVREVILEDDEVATILADSKVPEHLRGAIEFGWYTGWRVRSEVLPLTWDQIDLDRGEIRWPVGTTKNKRGRVLAFNVAAEAGTLDASIGDLLRRWYPRARNWRGKQYVFHHNGRPIKTKWFYAEWHAACARHGIKDARSPNVENHKMPHDLRRAAATRFTQAGMSEIDAMSFTGHETPSMFRRYNISDPKRQRAALAKVPAPKLQPSTE